LKIYLDANWFITIVSDMSALTNKKVKIVNVGEFPMASEELARRIFARHTQAERERQWQDYLRKAGPERMTKEQWYRFNYGELPPPSPYPLVEYARRTGAPSIEGASGADAEEIERILRGRRQTR